ncbi:FAD/NAD(P)-binding oxidoreductase [Prodigiosinella aquatilis]|nr:FAD/NAD(P)-binding oxidoreductase [Prodigiosinella sp. LS101]WJV55865.1 FAD/NAD(P)-binding oxidoreductase [Prodigiosinella sp. LS101]WJV60228.1 FAD/NAD(P)-binding oxidoreductase [Pectobacteriaceae bacterium C111]
MASVQKACKRKTKMSISRRTLLKSGLGLGALGAAGLAYNEIRKIKTNAKIVITGGGAGGISISNMLLRYLDGASITIIEPRGFHWYQPGQTLFLAGSYTVPGDVVKSIEKYIDRRVTRKQDSVVEFLPDKNTVVTAGGESIHYDYLIVSTGLELRYDMIEGLDDRLIGKNGIASIYHSPEAGIASYQQAYRFISAPGQNQAIFTRPQGAIKCAGAPMKATNLVESFAQQSPKRDRINFQYFTSESFLFSVKSFDDKLKEIWNQRQITPHYEHVLSALEPEKKTVTFLLADGSKKTLDWDFIHIVPPMLPPEAVIQSDLSDQEQYHGYLEVDQYTLQHKRYPNVFGLGDCVGTPIGKTAASVKSQLPIVTSNLCALLSGEPLHAVWDGYTSCPMILDVGHAMLWEFNYLLEPVTALPFQVIDPLEESTLAWRMEETLLWPVYDIMLKGYTPI